MKTKKNKKSSNLFLRLCVWLFLIANFFYVANEFYPLRDLYEKVFPIHYKSYAEFGIRIPTQYKVHGIDVSHHQGRINWKMVKQMKDRDLSLDFVFMKATEGGSHKDRRFKYNWRNAKSNGLIRGAYHYFKPNVKAAQQAKHFIRTVKLLKGDFPPVIDIEERGSVSTAKLMKGLKIFADELEKHYGVKPIIYTYHDFYKQNFDYTFKDYTLWIAHYHVRSPDNKTWNFWQHSDRGTVSGINYPVDFNVFNRDMETMKGLLIK
ncbi:MAG: glycoside hydrolase family 25 protein [Flavobacteriales bacterium]